jgi:rod shape-determining protein MreD
VSVPPDIAVRTGRRRSDDSSGLLVVAGLTVLAVLVQVSVVPYLRVADGMPDFVAILVVAVALLRGTLVGAVTGFAAGMAVELTAPIGTLGVLALLYLLVGAWCGRYTERPEAGGVGQPLLLVVAAVAFVQLGYAAMQLLQGATVPATMLLGEVLLPQIVLSALLAPPVLLLTRRLLGEPRVVEPYLLPR